MPQLMNDSKTLQRHPLTIEASFLRRTADGDHFYKDRVVGEVYNEYRETWRRLSDDPKWELNPDAPKERLVQVTTRRRFIYIDQIPGESDEDPDTKAQTDAMFFLIDPHDFTYHRFRPLHVGDCPMTNSRPEARTSCVCEHWEDMERDHIEGGGGQTVALEEQ